MLLNKNILEEIVAHSHQKAIRCSLKKINEQLLFIEDLMTELDEKTKSSLQSLINETLIEFIAEEQNRECESGCEDEEKCECSLDCGILKEIRNLINKWEK